MRLFLRKSFFYLALLLWIFASSSCYYVKSAYHQMHLLSQREPLAEVIASQRYPEPLTEKMKLTLAVMDFAEKNLQLKTNNNYRTFVDLGRPYVVQAVSAAKKWQLEKHEWNYPIVGRLPYKGFFSKEEALAEVQHLEKQGLDVSMRGVSAYSTLGWFRDPLLSTMLQYSPEDLIDTLIHESIHVTLFIKGSADFNERLAVYLASWGTGLFIKYHYGENSELLQKIKNDSKDNLLFSQFIDQEVKALTQWYQAGPNQDEALRKARLQSIQEKYRQEVKPKLTGLGFPRFEREPLNNAALLVYNTYMADLSLFEKLREQRNLSFTEFVQLMKTLENVKDPEKGLRDL